MGDRDERTRAMTDALRCERVADLDDPRLADYRDLKDADRLLRRGRFIVEGRGNLRVLLAQSPFHPDSILLGEAAFAALRPELAAGAASVPIFVAPQPVLEALVGFNIHRGALAACVRPAPFDAPSLAHDVLARSSAPRVLVLEHVSDADNVGGIFRSAMALGGRAVFACERTCDPLYRKAIRTSMGGSLRVPFARTADLPGFLETLRRMGFAVLAFDPKEPAEDLDRLRSGVTGPAALLFGTEGAGLTPAALAAADRRVRIAMEPGVDSLNVATAAAIGLHALRGRASADAADRDGG